MWRYEIFRKETVVKHFSMRLKRVLQRVIQQPTDASKNKQKYFHETADHLSRTMRKRERNGGI